MARVGAAGQFVPPRTLSEEALVFVWERLGGLWRWRELTFPPAAIYVAYGSAGCFAASWVAAALCIAVGSVGLVRPRVLSRIPRRCAARSRWHRRLRRWPRYCVGLHWYRKLEEGALLVPALLSWEERAGQVAVEVRPLPEQEASSWDAMADAFRRFLGGANVEWRESYGTLRIVVSRVGLPDFLPWHAHGAPEGRLVLGSRHGGKPLAIDARTTPHVLLAGATGSGKGGAIRAAAAAALQGGWHLVVLDPKEAGEYAWLEDLRVPVVTELREQLETLEHLAAVRHARQELVRRSRRGLLARLTRRDAPDLAAGARDRRRSR